MKTMTTTQLNKVKSSVRDARKWSKLQSPFILDTTKKYTKGLKNSVYLKDTIIKNIYENN